MERIFVYVRGDYMISDGSSEQELADCRWRWRPGDGRAHLGSSGNVRAVDLDMAPLIAGMATLGMVGLAAARFAALSRRT